MGHQLNRFNQLHKIYAASQLGSIKWLKHAWVKKARTTAGSVVLLTKYVVGGVLPLLLWFLVVDTCLVTIKAFIIYYKYMQAVNKL